MLNLKDYIRNIPDFPKPGIIFRDITTALKKPNVFRQIIDEIYFNFKDENIDYIAAIESRGYLFGAPLAYKLGAGLVIIRKPGKLPSKVERIEYELEYGTDSLEIHQDAVEPGKRVLVVDDLLATGGTICAACKLIEKIGGIVAGTAFLIELDNLKGKTHLPKSAKNIALLRY
ncbi:MAG: adenine phosphoribosyltransferase [Alphaproteobacteria bacterium]|nr:adenine phosphoribosyltransferase [Candidatus Scatocola faecigallinarum]